MLNLVFVGHLEDPIALGGVGLGNMMISITWMSIGMGLNGAIDTLVSQAYGDKQYYLWGCYLNRGRIAQLMILPVIIWYFYSEDFFIRIGQDPGISKATSIYLIYMGPGVFAMCQFETVRRFLQSMGKYQLSMYIQLVTWTLHFVWCYLFVFYLKMGVKGCSIATSITFWLNLIILTGYLWFKKDVVPQESWHFFNRDSFKNLGSFLKLGSFSLLMLMWEIWAFELTCLLAGWVSANALAANVILTNIMDFIFKIPFGMSFAVSNLIGNSLGQGKPNIAYRYWIASVNVMNIISLTIMVVIVIVRKQVGYIYTSEQDVIDIVSSTIPFFALGIFFDGIQCVLAGSIRGVGYQNFGSVISLISYWFIMLPLWYMLGIVYEFGVIGLWSGLTVGVMVSSSFYSFPLFCTQWQKFADWAIERIQKEQAEANEQQQDGVPLVDES